MNDMLADYATGGRKEKRLPLMVAIRLEPLLGLGNDAQEKTYTDNISPRGARVISRHLWQTGEIAKIASLHEGSICGQVVYCEKLPDDRYAVGVHVLDRPIPWSIVQRFWGT